MKKIIMREFAGIFLADLTLEGYLKGKDSSSVCQPYIDAIAPYVSGFICSPGNFQLVKKGKKEWDRWLNIDWTPGHRSPTTDLEDQVFPVFDIEVARSIGADYIVATLRLPNEAEEEADNIQQIAKYHTTSFQMGLPLVVDIQLPQLPDLSMENQKKVVLLSYNLAVELGADVIILPGVPALFLNEDLTKISSKPILSRCSLQFFNDHPEILNLVRPHGNIIDGIVFADMESWKEDHLDAFLHLASEAIGFLKH